VRLLLRVWRSEKGDCAMMPPMEEERRERKDCEVEMGEFGVMTGTEVMRWRGWRKLWME